MNPNHFVPPHVRSSLQPTEDEQLLQSPSPMLPSADFTRTDPWRVFRIMGEFIQGFDAMAHVGRAVAVFGSARTPATDPFYEHARNVSYLLGAEGFSIITGGGPGIMEAANKGAQESGALSVGCNIELPFEQEFNPYVTLPINFRYFFVRKTLFVKYAEAFVIFPGGFGTMDELFEALTLIQTGKIQNFPVFLFGSAYWKGLLTWMKESMLAEGKISLDDLNAFVVTDSPEQVRDVVLERAKERALPPLSRPVPKITHAPVEPMLHAGPKAKTLSPELAIPSAVASIR